MLLFRVTTINHRNKFMNVVYKFSLMKNYKIKRSLLSYFSLITKKKKETEKEFSSLRIYNFYKNKVNVQSYAYKSIQVFQLKCNYNRNNKLMM